MHLSITTDYISSKGNAKPFLKHIAEAGFSHIHWCHEWNTDYAYAEGEIDEIHGWLGEFDLQLLDLHGSAGEELKWCDTHESIRRRGVDLVRNRIDMAHVLGGACVVMHGTHTQVGEGDDVEEALRSMCRSLDELQGFAQERNIGIAIENGRLTEGLVKSFEFLFDRYPTQFLGLCYDSGHGNMGEDSLPAMEHFKGRLMAIHLHDNDGESDQHKIPFTGSVPWDSVAGLIATSSYQGCINLEVSKRNHADIDERTFLFQTREAAAKLYSMVTKSRAGDGD